MIVLNMRLTHGHYLSSQIQVVGNCQHECYVHRWWLRSLVHWCTTEPNVMDIHIVTLTMLIPAERTILIPSENKTLLPLLLTRPQQWPTRPVLGPKQLLSEHSYWHATYSTLPSLLSLPQSQPLKPISKASKIMERMKLKCSGVLDTLALWQGFYWECSICWAWALWYNWSLASFSPRIAKVHLLNPAEMQTCREFFVED